MNCQGENYKIYAGFFFLFLLIGCVSSYKYVEASSDHTYGFTPENPIQVGGSNIGIGSSSERKYLNRLKGPNGEQIQYKRRGSCCFFKTPNGFNGEGLLDAYIITYPGLKEPVVLYLNMYDLGAQFAPMGFRLIE